ncbi:MAG: NAD(P)/FAD-dependent oxidoreductase [Candidatus Eisenbacteria bacterium]|nr:NAD(P)/FAD-dependent oxidoreductase [Candidatus Eisenbacteria bacterium]
MHYRYVIVGGGIAAAAAIEGIRAHDADGSILLLSRENHLPYQRPPLSKDLWNGSLDLEQLAIHAAEFYEQQRVDVRLRREVVELDSENRILWDDRGESVGFDHALLVTGCRPRRLQARGADSPSVRYFRALEDYLALETQMERIQHVTTVGGGFTAVELSAALRARGKEVTMIFPEEWPLRRILPREIGMALVDYLRSLDIETVSGETLVEITEEGNGFVRGTTYGGNSLTTQIILVDQGSEPQVDLAEAANLDTDDGIVVDEYGRCSRPGFWAAGDVAEFPYLALGQLERVEGSEHAEKHGRCVGANMAGAGVPYTHLPLKWFRVADLQFECVGELHSRLDSEVVWVEEGREGVVFYLRDDVVRGVILINTTDRLDWARAIISDAKAMDRTERAALVAAARA